jgi:hypothetical protein
MNLTDHIARITKETPMAGRTSDELAEIERAEELELASLRRDGTLRSPLTMWAVATKAISEPEAWTGTSPSPTPTQPSTTGSAAS